MVVVVVVVVVVVLIVPLSTPCWLLSFVDSDQSYPSLLSKGFCSLQDFDLTE
jgi:hypothetical protein